MTRRMLHLAVWMVGAFLSACVPEGHEEDSAMTSRCKDSEGQHTCTLCCNGELAGYATVLFASKCTCYRTVRSPSPTRDAQ